MAREPYNMTQEQIDNIAQRLHSYEADDYTLKWGKQTYKYRNSMRKNVRNMLSALECYGFKLATRSQAESEIRKVRKDAEELLAAKDARIKELEHVVKSSGKIYSAKMRQIEALEAKLAAAEKALEPFANIADLIDAETEGMAETDELVLHFHDYEFAKWTVSLFRKARAVLGGKPS